MIPAKIKDAFPSIDMTCEEHPWLEWPHEDCLGPGMPVTASLAMLRSCVAERAVVSAAITLHNAEDALAQRPADEWDDATLDYERQLASGALYHAVDALLQLRKTP